MSSAEAKILVVDDDRDSSSALIKSLKRRGCSFEFLFANTPEAALAIQIEKRPPVALIDLDLVPGRGPESGFELLQNLLSADPSMRVLVLTGHGAESFGIRALLLGAGSFLLKPANPDHLLPLLTDAVAYSRLRQSFLDLSSTPQQISAKTGLSSRNPQMKEVLAAVCYAATTTQPVLISGETGTGKGVVAQAIHKASVRNTAPFVRYQPTYSGTDLMASELFGHRRGAFTGATEDRKGLIEEAHRGTLFIDELDSLSLELQTMLLHVLQEKSFRRLGTSKEVISDFRLITATNRNVQQLLSKGLMREDFFHRIAHFQITIPPLRERLEDIAELAHDFLEVIAQRERLPISRFSDDALKKLTSHTWPGNIRELHAVVEGGAFRAHFHGRTVVEGKDLEFQAGTKGRGTSGGLSFRERVDAFELQLIQEALQKNNFNQSKAAASLKLERSTLRRILERK